MREEISEKLDDVIVKLLEKIEGLKPGSEEHTKAVECLNKLYKLKIEETAHEREFMAKCEREVTDEREFRFKQEQAHWGRWVDGLKLGLELLGIGLPLCVYAVFLRRGFKFEETGTYTSKTFQNLIGWFKPKK